MGRYTGRKCRLLIMFALTASFFLLEIIFGYITNSMALVADSFHMLSDVAALVIAFLSVKMSPKKWSKNTFGWARAEVLGALVNAVFLTALCFSILVESLKRLYEIEPIHNPMLMLYVGAMGLAVNVIGLILFHKHGSAHGHSHGHSHRHSPVPNMNEMHDDNEDEDDYDTATETQPARVMSNGDTTKVKVPVASASMNMRGVFLHVMADALGSVIVVTSALVIWLTEWEYKYYVDPILSIVMVMLILKSVHPLLVESSLILLQTVPTHIQIEAIQKKLLSQIDGILAVHEFHVWQLAGDRIIASAHIRCRNLTDYMRIAEKVKEFFHNEGIHSTTIQPEFVELNEYRGEVDASDCVLDCPSDKKCAASTCCGPKKEGKDSPNLPSNPLADNCRQRTCSHAGACDHSENDNYVIGSDPPALMESGKLYSSRGPV